MKTKILCTHSIFYILNNIFKMNKEKKVENVDLMLNQFGWQW